MTHNLFGSCIHCVKWCSSAHIRRCVGATGVSAPVPLTRRTARSCDLYSSDTTRSCSSWLERAVAMTTRTTSASSSSRCSETSRCRQTYFIVSLSRCLFCTFLRAMSNETHMYLAKVYRLVFAVINFHITVIFRLYPVENMKNNIKITISFCEIGLWWGYNPYLGSHGNTYLEHLMWRLVVTAICIVHL